MTAQASKNRWLDPLGYQRYSQYWSPTGDDSAPDYDPGVQYEAQWRGGTLGRALLILVAHARRCGVEQEQFFLDARATMGHMESSLAKLGDDEIEMRARAVAVDAARRLLDGPEYPLTSLVLEGSVAEDPLL